MSVLSEEPQPPSSRGPKRSYRPAAERREQLLDCALVAFGERGYHATSIGDVCARAGVGRATLYQYFEDKRALLVALGERVAGQVIGAVEARPLVEPQPGVALPPRVVLRFVERRLLAVLEAAFHDPSTARLLLRVARGADGIIDDTVRRIDDALIGRMTDELRAAMDAGALRQADPEFVARFFLGGVEKCVMQRLDTDAPLDLPALAREAALLELFGVLGPLPEGVLAGAPGVPRAATPAAVAAVAPAAAPPLTSSPAPGPTPGAPTPPRTAPRRRP